MTIDRARFDQGLTYDAFKAQMTRNRERLEDNEKRVDLAKENVAAFRALPRPVKVVVLAEDWCGDVIARLWSFGDAAILSDGDRVYQPAKIALAGLLLATRGNVLVYEHKEDHLAEVERRFPAHHYVHVDDKASLLARTKEGLGSRATTIHVHQGHYAAEPKAGPAPDLEIDRISDLLTLDPARFRG